VDLAAEARRAMKRAKAGLPPPAKPAPEPEEAPPAKPAKAPKPAKAAKPAKAPKPAPADDLGLGEPSSAVSASPPAPPPVPKGKKGDSAALQWQDPVKRSRLLAGFIAKKAFPLDDPRSKERTAQVDVIADAIRRTSADAVKAKVGNVQPANLAALRALLK
jgi:hypothetical protein